MPAAPSTRASCTAPGRRPAWFRRRALGSSRVGTVEVRFLALDEGLVVIELFPSFDGDGAGIRCRLALDLRLRAWSTRGWGFAIAGTAAPGLRKPKLLALFAE